MLSSHKSYVFSPNSKAFQRFSAANHSHITDGFPSLPAPPVLEAPSI